MTTEWEDPPTPAAPQTGHYGAFQRFVAELRSRPGAWAIYRRDLRGNLSNNHYQHTDIEWRTVPNGDGTHILYGRARVDDAVGTGATVVVSNQPTTEDP